jgi:separase
MIGTLWDVTDKDIDRLAEEVYKKLNLNGAQVSRTIPNDGPGILPLSDLSNVEALGASRDACVLKYLTGAAPIAYGIPFYVH